MKTGIIFILKFDLAGNRIRKQFWIHAGNYLGTLHVVPDQTPQGTAFLPGISAGKACHGKRHPSPFPATRHDDRYFHHLPSSRTDGR